MKIKENIAVNAIFIVLALCCVIPFIMLISISVSNEKDIIKYGYSIIPKAISFLAYSYVLRNPGQIFDSYLVTAFTTAAGTVLSLVVMILVAYPLSRDTFVLRKQISFYLFFTMLFSGGLVPSYILMTQYLKIGNSIWVYILPTLVNVWYVILLRTFFQKLPVSLIESAKIDGAGEFRILAQIVVPMSTPVIATVALFGVLLRWNDWMTALLYINNDKLVTLQYLLQKIMMDIKVLTSSMLDLPQGISPQDIPGETSRMAMVVLAAGPMLFVFPFFQKYFVKGLTVGAVKG